MREIQSKKALEVVLSRLSWFEKGQVRQEQYTTPGQIAADLGCGTGILGIGCLLLGASSVYFVDSDDSAILRCKDNVLKLQSEGYALNRYELVLSDISRFDKKVDTVVMNPPFGTKIKHADKEFLVKAFSISKVTYSFHKTATKEYIMQLARRFGFNILERFDFKLMLKNTMKGHVKNKVYIDVSAFYFKEMGM